MPPTTPRTISSELLEVDGGYLLVVPSATGKTLYTRQTFDEVLTVLREVQTTPPQ